MSKAKPQHVTNLFGTTSPDSCFKLVSVLLNVAILVYRQTD